MVFFLKCFSFFWKKAMSVDALFFSYLSEQELQENPSFEKDSFDEKWPQEAYLRLFKSFDLFSSSYLKKNHKLLPMRLEKVLSPCFCNSSLLSRLFKILFVKPKSKENCPSQKHSYDFNLENLSLSMSKNYDLKKPELEKGEIGFINGILTDFQEAETHAFFLSSLAKGHNIHGVFKARRPLNLELFESLSPFDSPPALLLQKQWKKFFSQNPDLKYLQICHSQGALHVQKALMGLTEEERKRIVVVAIAPQVIISKRLCYTADNYLSTHDFIPFLNINGREKDLVEEIHIRNPDKKAPLWDHDFESATYREALKFHIEKYMKNPLG
jgi:hypothetical protein